MASQLVEILTLRFKSALVPDASASSPPPASFQSVADTIRATPGVSSLHLGQNVEDPKVWTAVICWASPAAHDAFVSSSASTERAAALRALIEDAHVPSRSVLLAGQVARVLDAPTMEVCTAWAVDDGFLTDRMAPFAAAVDAAALAGYHAQAIGDFDQTSHQGGSVPVPTGRASMIIIGWDSRDAHLQHKDSGSAIDENIHLIRSGRKSMELYHVNLKKL